MRMYIRLIPLVVLALGLGFVSTPEQAAATDWCSGAVCQEWVARYDGPVSGIDFVESMAVDELGNVYVTGGSVAEGWQGSGYATIKYSADGGPQWVASYHGGGAARAIGVDGDGNVYVTGGAGAVYGSDGGDYLTIKYDPDGAELWVSRYSGISNTPDSAYDLALDDVGNIYVTGEYFTGAEGREFDYATISYGPDGTERWVATYDGANLHDRAHSIAVDQAGSVYVTGTSQPARWDEDYVTIKYDSGGNQLWVARYDAADSGYPPEAIAVDSAGNVYITGESTAPGSQDDYVTIKYDTNGDEVWAVRWSGPGGVYDVPTALGLDAEGNVYVTGYSGVNDVSEDWITIKYDGDGNELWVARYGGPGSSSDLAQNLALDDHGNVYVTGHARGPGGDDDYTTIKYGPDGAPLWIATYDGPAHDMDRAMAISVNPTGNVYVAGSSVGIGTDSDYAIVKYAPSLTPTPTPTPAPPVGGTIEFQSDASAPSAQQSDSAVPPYAALAGLAVAAAMAAAAGAWYARRRLLR